jgi:DNA-binding NarL/FixJ family response regulator
LVLYIPQYVIMQNKIIICDDHILFLSGLSEVLKSSGNGYEIITFSDSNSCKSYIKQNTVDVFICDLNINNRDGFLVLEELKNELVNSKTIILTAYFEDFLIHKAERMGINAFLKKETSVEELIDVIESPLNTPFYTNKNYIKSINNYSAADGTIINKFRLSKQEKEIIKLIVQGKTSKEIADNLFISKTTVDTHRKNINRKLEITNSSSLIKFAYENNLFS